MKISKIRFNIDPFVAFLLVLTLCFLYQSIKISIAFTGKLTRYIEQIGPTGFALGLCILIIILIAALITQESFKPQEGHETESFREKIGKHDIRVIRFLAIIVLISGYIAVVRNLGFIVTSSLYLFSSILALSGIRKAYILLSIIVSLLVTFVVYLSYTYLFHVPLPGIL